MAAERDRNDVILMPRQYSIIKDMTKGNLSVNVGPIKVTLSDAERLMAPDPGNPTRLIEVSQEKAILPYIDAGESDYVVLSNPPKESGLLPKAKTANDMTELAFGRKINIPGPISFPLWPFQSVEVIKGHQLNMNQYLVVRVINDEEADANWSKGVVKAVEGAASEVAKKGTIPKPASLSVGQLIIIKGTEVSFYIPPTGLEVVKGVDGQYVRDAVTLEQLEYCVLVDQNGEKRFEQGPKVVFPTASEEFVVEDDGKKFKAVELTEISGLHIKVTAPYKQGDKQYKVGDELFITGKETPIYFPRAEHAIVRYGEKDKHYATAIPKGEGRYVMNRLTGEIRLVTGPKMLLPDPRTEVIVRRILSLKQVALWFPGNDEAIAVNEKLAEEAGMTYGSQAKDFLAYNSDVVMDSLSLYDSGPQTRGIIASSAGHAKARLVGDQMKRSETYTPPRSITLNTKYDGAVQVDVWTGYAVLVVDKNGNRKVEVGPKTILLNFDQNLASVSLSTGKPKTTDQLFRTSYLRVLNNQVSDIVTAMTSDDIPVKIKTSYRVNFLPEYQDKWFDSENYVKLLCDHIRSKLRNVVKKIGVQELADKHIDLVRDSILGVSTVVGETKKPRPGMTFQENGAHIYDVEVLGLEIGDQMIANQLIDAQRKTIQDALQITNQKRQLELAKEQERINQELELLKAQTEVQKIGLRKKIAEENATLQMDELQREITRLQTAQEAEKEKQLQLDIASDSERKRRQAESDYKLATLKEELALELKKIEEETKNLGERSKAITPQLIAAFQRFADMSLVEKMADSMAPMALLGGRSVKEVLSGLLKGSGLENLLDKVELGNLSHELLSGNGGDTVASRRM